MKRIKNYFKKSNKKQIFLGGICALLIISAITLAIVTRGTYADVTNVQYSIDASDITTSGNANYDAACGNGVTTGLVIEIRDLSDGSVVARFGDIDQSQVVGNSNTVLSNTKSYGAKIIATQCSSKQEKIKITLSKGMRWQDYGGESTLWQEAIGHDSAGSFNKNNGYIVTPTYGDRFYLKDGYAEYTIAKNNTEAPITIKFRVEEALILAQIIDAIKIERYYDNSGEYELIEQQAHTFKTQDDIPITINGNPSGATSSPEKELKVLANERVFSTSRIAGLYRNKNTGSFSSGFVKTLFGEIKVNFRVDVTKKSTNTTNENIVFSQTQDAATNYQTPKAYAAGWACTYDDTTQTGECTINNVFTQSYGINLAWVFENFSLEDEITVTATSVSYKGYIPTSAETNLIEAQFQPIPVEYKNRYIISEELVFSEAHDENSNDRSQSITTNTYSYNSLHPTDIIKLGYNNVGNYGGTSKAKTVEISFSNNVNVTGIRIPVIKENIEENNNTIIISYKDDDQVWKDQEINANGKLKNIGNNSLFALEIDISNLTGINGYIREIKYEIGSIPSNTHITRDTAASSMFYTGFFKENQGPQGEENSADVISTLTVKDSTASNSYTSVTETVTAKHYDQPTFGMAPRIINGEGNPKSYNSGDTITLSYSIKPRTSGDATDFNMSDNGNTVVHNPVIYIVSDTGHEIQKEDIVLIGNDGNEVEGYTVSNPKEKEINGRIAKIYKIDTSTATSNNQQVGLMSNVLESKELTLTYKINTNPKYSDNKASHYMADHVYVTSEEKKGNSFVYAQQETGTLRVGDPYDLLTLFEVIDDGTDCTAGNNLGVCPAMSYAKKEANKNYYTIKTDADINASIIATDPNSQNPEEYYGDNHYEISNTKKGVRINVNVSNDSGVATTTKVYIPIPKEGESWDDITNDNNEEKTPESFAFTMNLTSQLEKYNEGDIIKYCSIDRSNTTLSTNEYFESVNNTNNCSTTLPADSSGINLIIIETATINDGAENNYSFTMEQPAIHVPNALNNIRFKYYRSLVNSNNETFSGIKTGNYVGIENINQNYTITTNHYETDPTVTIITPIQGISSTTETAEYYDSYVANNANILSNYRLVKVTNKVGSNNATVEYAYNGNNEVNSYQFEVQHVIDNTTINYYYMKYHDITVKHYITDKNGTIETATPAVDANGVLIPDVTVQKLVAGDTYTAKAAATIPTDKYTIAGIRVNNVPKNISTNAIVENDVDLTITDEDITVEYYYKPNTYNITVKHINDLTGEEFSSETNEETYAWNSTTYAVTADTTKYEKYNVVEVDRTIGSEETEHLIATLSQTNNYEVSVQLTDNVEIVYHYMPKQYNLTVHHYIKGTTTKALDQNGNTVQDDVYNGQYYDTIVNTGPFAGAGYIYTITTPTGNNIVDGKVTIIGNQEIVYYYEPINFTLTINHYLLDDEGHRTTTRILDENLDPVPAATDSNKPFGSTFDVEIKPNLKAHYTLKEITISNPNTEITVDASDNRTETKTFLGNTEVNYYYEVTNYTVTTHYYKKGTTENVFDPVEQVLAYGANYTTSKIEDSHYTIEEPNNKTGRVTGNIDVIYNYIPKNYTVTTYHCPTGVDCSKQEHESEKLHDPVEQILAYNTEYQTSSIAELTNHYAVTTPENATGTVTGNIKAIYYYTANGHTVTVHHYLVNTETKLAEDETIGKVYGDTYKTNADATLLENYIVTEPNNATGTVGDNDITVFYYYTPKNYNVTAYHCLVGFDCSTQANSSKKLHDPVTQTLPYDTTYETSSINELLANYTVEEPENKTGIVTGNTKAIYYYTPKDYVVTTHHYLANTETKLSADVTQTLAYNSTYETEAIGSLLANYTVEEPENKTGTVKGTTEVTYYYTPKDYVVTTHHYLVNTTTKLNPDVTQTLAYNSTYETASIESLLANYTVTNPTNASGTVTGNVEAIYYYTPKKYAVTTHHYLCNTSEKLHDDVIQSIDYNESYETSYIEELLEHHNVTIPDNATGTVLGNTEVNYCYTKKIYLLKVIHNLVDENNELIRKLDETMEELPYNTAYETKSLAETGGLELPSEYYTITHTGPEAGNIDKDTTVIYSYQIKQGGNIIVKYQDQFGNAIKEEKTLQGLAGQTYNVEIPSIEGYVHKETIGNLNGAFTLDPQTIIIIYNELSKGVTVEYVDEDDNIIPSNPPITICENGIVGENCEVLCPEIEDYTLKTDPNPFNVELTKEPQQTKCVYEINPSPGVKVDYVEQTDEETEEQLKDPEINCEGDKIGQICTITCDDDIEGYRLDTENFDTAKEFTLNRFLQEYKCYYSKRPIGKVIVKYQDLAGKELRKDDITENYVGEEYVAEAKEISGYTLKGDKKATGMYKIEDTVIVFRYEKVPNPYTVDYGPIPYVTLGIGAFSLIAALIVLKKKKLSAE